MRKVSVLFLCLLCLLLVGCNENKSKNQGTNNQEKLSEKEEENGDLALLKEQIDDLTTKLTTLEEENKTLTVEINALKETDNSIKTTQTNNYNELKKLVNSKTNASAIDKYTITEKELKGTWTYTFITESGKKETRTAQFKNYFVIGNMICTKREEEGYSVICYPYQYANKKLYILSGGELTKK